MPIRFGLLRGRYSFHPVLCPRYFLECSMTLLVCLLVLYTTSELAFQCCYIPFYHCGQLPLNLLHYYPVSSVTSFYSLYLCLWPFWFSSPLIYFGGPTLWLSLRYGFRSLIAYHGVPIYFPMQRLFSGATLSMIWICAYFDAVSFLLLTAWWRLVVVACS